MSIENQILFWNWLGWLLGPILGLIGGIATGLVNRHYDEKVDANTTKPQLYHISIGIGIALVIIGYVVSYPMFPTYWKIINMEGFSIRTAVTFLFYVIIFEFTMIQVANKKKKEA